MGRGPRGAGRQPRRLLPLLLLLGLASGGSRAPGADGECGEGAGAPAGCPGWALDDAGRARDASPPPGRAGAEPGRGAQVGPARAVGAREGGAHGGRRGSPPPPRAAGGGWVGAPVSGGLALGARDLGRGGGWARAGAPGENGARRGRAWKGAEGRSGCTVTLPALLWLLRDKFLTRSNFLSTF